MSGDTDRAARLGRLLQVQNRKRQLEEWRLADLKREEIALGAASAEILQSLGDASLLNGLFLEAKSTTLRRNEGKIVRNASAQTVAAATLREARSVEKRLERAARDARESEARSKEQARLVATLDDFLAARAASLE